MKQHHQRPDIKRLLSRRARQGLTFRELSEESGIPIPTLSYWASKQRREVELPKTEFVPVEVTDNEVVGAISIEIESGLRLHIKPGFDEAHLARVLSALESRC